jgi:hypothetical protein
MFIEVFKQNADCLSHGGLLGETKTIWFSKTTTTTTKGENCLSKTQAKSSLACVNRTYEAGRVHCVVPTDLTPLLDFVSSCLRKTLACRPDNNAQCNEISLGAAHLPLQLFGGAHRWAIRIFEKFFLDNRAA